MGLAIRSDALGLSPESYAQAANDELSRVVEGAIARSETQARSGRAVALAAALATLVAAGPHLPFARVVLGDVTGPEAAIIAAIGWAVFALATASYRTTNATLRAAYPGLSTLDELGHHGVLLSLVYFSGSASSALWLIGLARAFSWTAKAQTNPRRTLTLLLVSHGTLIAAFLSGGRIADAALTMLVVLASTSVCLMTAQSSARAFRIRAEREVLDRRLHAELLENDRRRIARELHDGVGSDVMTLVLRLRRANDERSTPEAAHLLAQAERILGDLRGVVWSLRNEQGTLAELGKMIDLVRPHRAGAPAYDRTTPPDFQRTRVGPIAAMAALSAARTLVHVAETRPGVRKVSVLLSVAPTGDLQLGVDDDGDTRDDAERTETITAVTNALAVVGGRLRSEEVAGAGTRMRATIRMDVASLDGP